VNRPDYGGWRRRDDYRFPKMNRQHARRQKYSGRQNKFSTHGCLILF